MIEFLLLVVGMAMLLGGGDLLVRGASSLARSLGVSSLVIGLTVVAFGTSAPELAVNATAAVKGSSDVSFGNIIGSNIANIGLIIGCAALIRPLNVKGTVISREIPMMLLATLAVTIMGLDMVLRGDGNVFDRSDALIMFLFFCIFLYYTVSEVVQHRPADTFVSQTLERGMAKEKTSVILDVILTGAGLILLIYGGKMTVDAAVSIARSFHVSEAIIGLVLVAVGTSLPELVTSVVATFKGQSDLAMGNVVGSNIFNLLFILGVTSAIKPVPLPAAGYPDLAMMTALSVILLPFAISGQHRISRPEGGTLLVLYCGYMAWRVLYSV